MVAHAQSRSNSLIEVLARVFSVDALDDDGASTGRDPAGPFGRGLPGKGAGDDHRIGGYAPVMDPRRWPDR